MSESKVVPVLVTSAGSNVNACLINYWRPFLQVVDDPTGGLSSTDLFQRQRDCIGFTVLGSKAYHFWEAWAVVQKEWEAQGRGPLLRLDEEHATRGRAVLSDSLRLKDGDWFVCLHVREPGFHQDQTGLYQTTRNADIETYRPAVEKIVRMGGKVIRMGDSSMKPFSMEGVYDYALTPQKFIKEATVLWESIKQCFRKPNAESQSVIQATGLASLSAQGIRSFKVG